MNQIHEKHNLPDVRAFIESFETVGEFSGEAEIFIARAPGRLDVMGGIADYSGALVLEMPIREAALVAVQTTDQRILKIMSRGTDGNSRSHVFQMLLDDLESNNQPLSYAQAQMRFKSNTSDSWAAYVAGAFLVLMCEKNAAFVRGATILIDSKVPEGKGVSSSAALEVAAMKAIAAAFKIEIEPRELAILCQKVENLVVGAPCGVMDQMSSVCGAENQLLSMICQPAEVRGAIAIPENLAFWGIDSGIRHSVGAGDYGSVRTGAFMGYRIIADLAGLKVNQSKMKGVVEIADDKWNGYLANIAPAEFEKKYAAHLPQEIRGVDFLDKYQGITDTVTRVAPEKTYQVFSPTAHPIYENMRVHNYAKLLGAPVNHNNLIALGELMYQSHASYTACGLGTSGTDLLVELVKKSPNLYGAKITGGGSGGTVAVLGWREASDEIEKISGEYERQSGHRPYIFAGSSPGAAAFDVLKLG